MKANDEIRAEALQRKVPLWQIAEKLGIADTTFSRKLRHELPNEEKQRVMEAIREIAEERGEKQ